MTRSVRYGFTLVELLVVIAMIGVMLSILLPAVQSARESARRAHCTNNLAQLIIGVLHYESAHRVYPSGTIEATGPIRNVAEGYHHGWITRLLPYIEERAAYRHVDRSVGVYHANNAPVRDLNIRVLSCPTTRMSGPGYSNYAAVHHDVEAPIDANNNGVFFLNSRIRYLDVSDGASQTLFLGEKISIQQDLGWMSGTRATLRNTGTPLNAVLALRGVWGSKPVLPSRSRSREDTSMEMGAVMEMQAGEFPDPDDPPPPPAEKAATEKSPTEKSAAEKSPTGNSAAEKSPTEPSPTEQSPTEKSPTEVPLPGEPGPEELDGLVAPFLVDGQPGTETMVGGFASEHTGGVQFAFGDGSVRFLGETIDFQVLQQLGNRGDGKLLDQDF